LPPPSSPLSRSKKFQVGILDLVKSRLVVDDDPAVLDLLAEMLKDLGREVITTLNRTDALTALVLVR
jgi:hypothetical protein